MKLALIGLIILTLNVIWHCHVMGAVYPKADAILERPQKQQRHDDPRINTIVLSIAMIDEAQPLIQKLGLTRSIKHSQELAPFQVYQNRDLSNSRKIYLIVNGKDNELKCDRVGTQWATLSTYLSIHKLSPDVIINAGTCGGVVPKYAFDGIQEGGDAASDGEDINIADVFIGDMVIYSDRRVPFDPWAKWAPGEYKLFGAKYLSEKIEKLKIGKCLSSSNAFDYTKEDQRLFKQYGVVAKDMEAAAIAEMCRQFGTKMIALKGVTDLVNHSDNEHFMENMQRTSAAVTEVTLRVIKEIMGKRLSELEDYSARSCL